MNPFRINVLHAPGPRRRVEAGGRLRGFTLVEMAIAMLVLTLILGSILVPLERQVEQRQIANTQAALSDVREALLGFAVANGYLPCPAISATNGLEDRTAGVCTGGKRQGFLPWQTLGASKLDAWGNIINYSVTLTFASSAAPFTLSMLPTTAGGPDITIQTRSSAGALTNLTNATTVVGVVLSLGKNGNGATNDQGIAQSLPSTWPASYPDENTNASGTTIFVSRDRQDQGALGAGGEFDDIVVWLPAYTLFNRMVTARQLP